MSNGMHLIYTHVHSLGDPQLHQNPTAGFGHLQM